MVLWAEWSTPIYDLETDRFVANVVSVVEDEVALPEKIFDLNEQTSRQDEGVKQGTSVCEESLFIRLSICALSQKIFLQWLLRHMMYLPPMVVVLSANESVDDFESLKMLIKALKQQGVRLCISGLGSDILADKTWIPLKPDFIMLDKAFLIDLDKSMLKKKLLERVQQQIGAYTKLIAEGVESVELRDALKTFGISFYQSETLRPPTPMEARVMKKHTAELPDENLRHFFRVKLVNPICAKVKAVAKDIRKPYLQSYNACVADIGPGGMCVLVGSAFPAYIGDQIQLKAFVFNQEMQFDCFIVRARKLSDGIVEFGLRFKMDEHRRMQFTQQLNNLIIRIKKDADLSDCRFCERTVIECLSC